MIKYKALHDLCLSSPSRASFLLLLSISHRIKSFTAKSLLTVNDAQQVNFDNSIQCSVDGKSSVVDLILVVICHPEAIIERSLSILVGLITRFISETETSLSPSVSVSSNQTVDVNAVVPPLYPLVDFEVVLAVEDPGMILAYVDTFVVSSKAAEIGFPRVTANLIHRFEYNKENWLMATLGVEFATATMSVAVLDLLSTILGAHEVASSVKEADKVERVMKMEERGSMQETPSFYEENDYSAVEKNKRIGFHSLFS